MKEQSFPKVGEDTNAVSVHDSDLTGFHSAIITDNCNDVQT